MVNRPGFGGDFLSWKDDLLLPKQYPSELRERAVRLVAEHRGEYETEYAAIRSIAAKLGIATPETLRQWMRKAEIDAGQRPGVTSEESAEIQAAQVRERRAAPGERDPQGGLGFLRGRARPAAVSLLTFIDEQQVLVGEPICSILTEHGAPIAPSRCYAAKSRPP